MYANPHGYTPAGHASCQGCKKDPHTGETSCSRVPIAGRRGPGSCAKLQAYPNLSECEENCPNWDALADCALRHNESPVYSCVPPDSKWTRCDVDRAVCRYCSTPKGKKDPRCDCVNYGQKCDQWQRYRTSSDACCDTYGLAAEPDLETRLHGKLGTQVALGLIVIVVLIGLYCYVRCVNKSK